MDREALDKNKAVSTQMLDSYLKDVVGSFLLFFIVIGPVTYQSWWNVKQIKENEVQEV